MYPDTIIDLRQRLDKLARVISYKDRKIDFRSREISLARTHLQQARMFLGLELSESSEEDPYPKGNDVTTKVVEPAKDLFEGKLEDEVIEDRILQSKHLRATIKEISQSVGDFGQSPWLDQVIIQLAQARMWLGMDMGIVSRKED